MQCLTKSRPLMSSFAKWKLIWLCRLWNHSTVWHFNHLH